MKQLRNRLLKIQELAACYCYYIILITVFILHVVSMLVSGFIYRSVLASGACLFTWVSILVSIFIGGRAGRTFRFFPILVFTIYRWETYLYLFKATGHTSDAFLDEISLGLFSLAAIVCVISLFIRSGIITEFLWRGSCFLYVAEMMIWPIRDMLLTIGFKELQMEEVIDILYYDISIALLIMLFMLEAKPDSIGIGVRRVWKMVRSILVSFFITFFGLFFLDHNAEVTKDMRVTVLICFSILPFISWVKASFIKLFKETKNSLEDEKQPLSRKEAYILYENRDYAKEYFEKSFFFSAGELARLYELQACLKAFLSTRLLDERNGKDGFYYITEEELRIFEELNLGFRFDIDYDLLLGKEDE